MFCETCVCVTPCIQTKVRLTKDGREIVIQLCELCHTRTEIEYYSYPKVSFKLDKKKSDNDGQ